MGTRAGCSHSSITYRSQEDASEGTDGADPLLASSMEDEERERGETRVWEISQISSGPDNGAKRLEERVSRRRTNGSCDGGGKGRCSGSGLGHGGKVS